MTKSLLPGSLVVALLACGNAAGVAAEVPELPASGTTHFTTYFSVHPAHVVEMVEDSSITVAELVGITVNPDGEPHFHNMVVHCLVTIRAVKGDQELYGACKETDKDGDSTSTTFDTRRTTSSAVPASTKASPGKRRSRSRPCPRRVRGWAR
jgi:hypothetical protein